MFGFSRSPWQNSSSEAVKERKEGKERRKEGDPAVEERVSFDLKAGKHKVT